MRQFFDQFRNMQARPRTTSGHRADIERGKGVAILLVVFGHLIARGHPPGNAWYDTAKDIVYSFHMPFFMYLSGYVYFLTGKHRLQGEAYHAFLRNRCVRLLVPFVVFGLLIVAGKYLFHFFAVVDDPPRSLPSGVEDLIVDTDKSPALSIWYVYVLFIYSALMPLLWRAAGGRWMVVVAAALALYVLPSTDKFYLARVMNFFVFFIAGGLVASHPRMEAWFQRALPLWLMLFVVALASEWTTLSADTRLLICGLASIPALHGLVQSRLFERDQVLLTFGTYAFTIYLLNTITIGLVKAGYLEFAPLGGSHVWIALPLLFAAGAILPILIKRYVIARVPAIDRMMS